MKGETAGVTTPPSPPPASPFPALPPSLPSSFPCWLPTKDGRPSESGAASGRGTAAASPEGCCCCCCCCCWCSCLLEAPSVRCWQWLWLLGEVEGSRAYSTGEKRATTGARPAALGRCATGADLQAGAVVQQVLISNRGFDASKSDDGVKGADKQQRGQKQSCTRPTMHRLSSHANQNQDALPCHTSCAAMQKCLA
eukprot:1161640-Pelagomonas_calceolata.AAC.5